ncbi:histidine triad nucleotide-binding protein [bacterium]|nr:histidine triad nucleotide-binding protein [bacterium]
MNRDTSCLFCRIAAGEIPCRKLFEDELILAFEDIKPQAPFHALIIPKEHFPTVADIPVESGILIGRMVSVANQLARENRLDSGYRLVINCYADAGQEVYHVHLHLLGGRKFHWPPG